MRRVHAAVEGRAALLPAIAWLLACTAAVDAAEAGSSEASDTAATGPSDGAPDEHCGALDPDHVHVLRRSAIEGVHLVIDAEDRTRVCAYADPEGVAWDLAGRIDPADGSLVVLQAGDGARAPAVLRLQNDWLVATDDVNNPWTATPTRDDEVLGTILGDDGACPATAFERDEVGLSWWAGAFYTACQRTVASLVGDTRMGFATGRFLGVVDGAVLIHTDASGAGKPGSYAAVVDGVRHELALPTGVDRMTHVAARPGANGLLAAVRMHHGDLVTLERVWLHPSGITRAGSYDDDPVSRVACASFAVAVDGSLWCATADAVPTLARVGPSGPAEVAFALDLGNGPVSLL